MIRCCLPGFIHEVNRWPPDPDAPANAPNVATAASSAVLLLSLEDFLAAADLAGEAHHHAVNGPLPSVVDGVMIAARQVMPVRGCYFLSNFYK